MPVELHPGEGAGARILPTIGGLSRGPERGSVLYLSIRLRLEGSTAPGADLQLHAKSGHWNRGHAAFYLAKEC